MCRPCDIQCVEIGVEYWNCRWILNPCFLFNFQLKKIRSKRSTNPSYWALKLYLFWLIYYVRLVVISVLWNSCNKELNRYCRSLLHYIFSNLGIIVVQSKKCIWFRRNIMASIFLWLLKLLWPHERPLYVYFLNFYLNTSYVIYIILAEKS